MVFLREVVTYKSQTAGGLLREEVQAPLLSGEIVLHAISRLQYTCKCTCM